jgi:DNA-binding NarL/FixJ family response regulator
VDPYLHVADLHETVARQYRQVAKHSVIAVLGGHALHDPAACAFARQYELTSAQSKVHALIFDGQPPSTIAHSLSIFENTVRISCTCTHASVRRFPG